MKIIKTVAEPITSQEKLTEALLSRIPEEARKDFFAPPHPKDLTEEQHGISKDSLLLAKKRIEKAITNQEKVLVFGDYDCDGVTATAVLWETLAELGLKTQPFLPHREKHGYGLSVTALEEIWQEVQPDLVITVDNGIVAHEAFLWLKEHGVDTILTDHHSSDGVFPKADIVVHSTQLAGVTVAWMLAHTLDPKIAEQKLDYAVLGTLADQVPLYGANRSFAFHGLEALRNTTRASLLAIAKATSTDLTQATTETVHYTLAPRINAMGRLGDAMDALRALVSKNPERTQHLVRALQETNSSRQELTNELYEEVLESLEHESEHIVVVAGEFHEGIIGLLASKIVDVTHKPAIVLSTTGEVAKASVRSIPGIDIIGFLRSLTNISYLSLGGHTMAAGFSVEKADLASSLQIIRDSAKEKIASESLLPSLTVLGNLQWDLLNTQTLDTLKRFAPFGSGNEAPVFLLEEIGIRDFKPVGKEGKHWQLVLEDLATARQTRSIFFRAADKMTESLSEYRAVAIQLSESQYHGRKVDVIIKAALSN